MNDAILITPEADQSDIELLLGPLPTRRASCLAWLAGQPLVVPAVGLTIGILLDAHRQVPLPAAVCLFLAAGVIAMAASAHAESRVVSIATLCLLNGDDYEHLKQVKIDLRYLVTHTKWYLIS